MITVLLVDDHALLRKSLQDLMRRTEDIQVAAMATNGAEAIAEATLNCPDVLILDIAMPKVDGFEAAQEIGPRCPRTRILMLSAYYSFEYVRRALQAGAVGYVAKDDITKELVLAIRAVHKGERYFSQKVAELPAK